MVYVCRWSEKQRKKVHLFTPLPLPRSLKRFVDGLGSNRETWQLLLTPVMSDRLLPRPLHHWQMETRGFILLCILPTPMQNDVVWWLAASRLQGRSKWMLRFGWGEMKCRAILTRPDTGQPPAPWHQMRVVASKNNDPRTLSRGNYKRVNNLIEG